MTSLAGWLMIVVSGLALFVAFPGQYDNAPLPGLVGTIGIPFAIAYMAFQLVLAAYLSKARVWWLVTGLFLVGVMLSAVGRAVDFHGVFAEHNISYVEYLLCGGSCTSGLGLGIATVRGWTHDKA